MEKLYYVVERLTENLDNELDELTGWKNIRVYKIIKNQIKDFCTIDSIYENYSENEIQIWLDENGYEDIEFKLIEL